MCIFLSISFPLPLLTVVLPDAFCNLAALNENFQISFMKKNKCYLGVFSNVSLGQIQLFESEHDGNMMGLVPSLINKLTLFFH